jgi:hypothetical protein
VTAEQWPFSATLQQGAAARARTVAARHEVAERARAVRTVAGRAHDRSDLLMLLSVLGLSPDDCQQRDT